MNVLVLFSGGMDSTTLLYHHMDAGNRVRAISFDYGQRHIRELSSARDITSHLKVPWVVANLSRLQSLLPGSSQTDSAVDVPEGRYDDKSMELTVVPNRNMIFLSVAIGVAIAHRCDAVSYAAHAGDHAIYRDCRPEFASAMDKAALLCDARPINLHRPFILMTKAQIVSRGAKLGVDFLSTWSCYVGAEVHCGRCGTCIERREAFHLANVADPTTYGESAPSVEDMVKSNWHLPKRC